jgi:RNA polymerase sigma-70 factor (ECF subfamily)
MSENEIIKGCLNYDRESQKALYEQFYSKMSGVCLRYSKDVNEAKEMLCEGFLNVFSNLKNYTHKSSLEIWIKEIIVKASVDHLRKNKQNLIVSTVYANEKAVTDEDLSDDELVLNINKEEILKAVQELTPAYRTVFNLYLIEKYTHKEIAEMLDISESTSESNLSKAKYNLRKNIVHSIGPRPKRSEGVKRKQTKQPPEENIP